MNELHLFAGAGGGILGGILLGHTTVCAVEIEPYCREVLLQRQRDGMLPRFPIWDDVRTFDGKPWRGLVDVVCGGFPCQDISINNPHGKGIAGERSGLWKEFSRIIQEADPLYAWIENSPRLAAKGIEVVLGDLAKMGFDAEWGVFSCRETGGVHLRQRIWILASNNRKKRRKRSCQKRFLGSRDFRGTKMSEALRTCEQDPQYLNPLFGELTMMWPMGWTDLQPLEMGKFQEWQHAHGKH